ncbi:DUF177 domain-containing protein [Olivibacter sp. SDN3]|uniref:YceD family protein n=1 Tax=Olivibacter sp. SDN3 TaxID=2764720 RepID=UPI001650E6BB|nr:DUF177 domain-containing protein [Olivibacter sp. SDN3]QNL50073.1 DUF177 domain-containing protein [Olivibacter sp. SDN3]
MKILNQYRIPFTGLKLGKHEFEFEVDKHFFAEFEYSIVKDGALKVFLTLDKQETMLIADFHITGIIELTCDVCLRKFPGKTDINERLIVKFQEDDDTSDISDEILILKRNEHELDLANNIYEYINLSVPLYARCEEQGLNTACDKSMIDKLKNLSAPETRDTQTDPRWDILKKIKNN